VEGYPTRLLDAMKQLNQHVYPLVDYFDHVGRTTK
jgi:hypothetical protein